MFEQRKTIKVNGVSFDMILVEGDKFSIGDKEFELEDFYMAEIPVTQELYMAIMGPAHTGSFDMMPNYDNNPYLKIKTVSYRNNISLSALRNETPAERQKRFEKEIEEEIKLQHQEQELRNQERERIRNYAKKLPVNNISWYDSIMFLDKLNKLTGLNFALPSLEQWYFAASGGIESKGYVYPGSDDPGVVGHFYKLMEHNYSPGLYVMTGDVNKSPTKIAPTNRYQEPKRYIANELGIFDMTGLVNEWLDEAGKVIGGSFHSDPGKVSKNSLFGYGSFNSVNYLHNTNVCRLGSKYNDNLFGLRLVLNNRPKHYKIPEEPKSVIKVSDEEKQIVNLMFNLRNLGVLRDILVNKISSKPNFRTSHVCNAFKGFSGNIYNVFICPQNLNDFNGNCFNLFPSRRKFIEYCQQQYLKLLKALSMQGFNLLILDCVDMELSSKMNLFPLNIDWNQYNFKSKNDIKWIDILKGNRFLTNNPQIIQVEKKISRSGEYDSLKLENKTIFIEINDTTSLHSPEEIKDNWFFTKWPHNDIIRINLSYFLDFKDAEFDYKYNNSIGLTRFIKERSVDYTTRINNQDYDNTTEVNRFFCKRNKGGLFEYVYDKSEGPFLIQDDKFFILPMDVYSELLQKFKV